MPAAPQCCTRLQDGQGKGPCLPRAGLREADHVLACAPWPWCLDWRGHRSCSRSVPTLQQQGNGLGLHWRGRLPAEVCGRLGELRAQAQGLEGSCSLLLGGRQHTLPKVWLGKRSNSVRRRALLGSVSASWFSGVHWAALAHFAVERRARRALSV